MNFITTIFNNREIAIIVWFLVLIIFTLFLKNIRVSILNVLKAFLKKSLLSSNFFMLFYVILIVFLFYKIGLWNISLLKETIIWFFGVAFIMLINSNKANENENYFKDVILANLKLIVFVQFIVNIYVFNIVIELIFIPVMAFIAMSSAVAETKKEYMLVKKIIDNTIVFIGIGSIIYALLKIIIDFQNIANISTLHKFVLPSTLTFVFLPFIYFIALYMRYENIFVRINLYTKDRKISRYAKRKICTFCHFNLRKLNKFSNKIGIASFDKKDDVLLIIKKFKASSVK